MRLADLPFRDRLLIRAYGWRTVRPVPCARLTRPIASSRVALVTTAGLFAPGDMPFDLAAQGGDVSYRVLRVDTRVDTLVVSHRSEAFDRTSLERDRNVVFPLDRLRELASAGIIGNVAPRHLSFMGSITAPGRLRAETAPEAAGLFVDDQVDVALLVPV